MKTFKEFTLPEVIAPAKKSFPTFEDVMSDNEGKTCMSEEMMEKLDEMYESMCEEMKACHNDESENTAESYNKACSERLNEMMEGMTKACENMMK